VHEIIGVGCRPGGLVDGLELIVLGCVLAAVVSHVPAVGGGLSIAQSSFLVVAVELLDVQASPSLMSS
jgi:hypothetical protein